MNKNTMLIPSTIYLNLARDYLVAAVLLGGAELLRTISRKAGLEALLVVGMLGLNPANLFDIRRCFSRGLGL